MYKKVMVIDDNKVDRFVAETVMQRHAFAEEIVCEESAVDALEYLASHEQIPEDLPELIFLDINMPIMSGFDFLDAYEKLSDTVKRKCIIVMLTTSLNESDHRRAVANEYVYSFLNKPITKEKVDNFEANLKRPVNSEDVV